jgi:outer membrane protein
MEKIMRAVLTLVLCLLSVAVAVSQVKTLTLEEAIQIALERNLSAVEAQTSVDAAHSQVLAARGQWLPSLSASGNASRSRSETKASGVSTQIINGVPIPVVGQAGSEVNYSNSFRAGLNANWTVFDGLGREADNAGATSRSRSAELNAVRTRQTVFFQTYSAYINVLRNNQLVKVSEENVRRDQRQLERITESNRVGALSLADVYRQQSQVATDELALINAQNNYDKARADLVSFIGLNTLDDVQLVEVPLQTEVDSAAVASTNEKYRDLLALSKRALTARPDYVGATENLSAADASVTSAKSGYWPSLSISGGYSRYGSQWNNALQNSSLNWGAGVSWTLFDGFRTNQAVQSAVASRRNAEMTLAQTELQVASDVKKALLDLEAARKSMDVSEKALVSASEDRKIAEERYNLGAGTLLDLLVANANYVNAAANKVNSSYGYIYAKRNVEYALGERTY